MNMYVFIPILFSGDEASARAISSAQPACSETTTVLHPPHHRASGSVSVACATGPYTAR